MPHCLLESISLLTMETVRSFLKVQSWLGRQSCKAVVHLWDDPERPNSIWICVPWPGQSCAYSLECHHAPGKYLAASLDRGTCLSDEPVQWHLSQLAPGEFSIWVNGHYLTAHEQHVVALGLLVLPWVREIHIYICMCIDAYCVQNNET